MKVVLAVFDAAVQAYATPMFLRSVGEGLRMFTDEVNRAAQDNPLYMHPEDYDLVHLAVFNEDQGSFEALPDGSVVVIRGKDASQRGKEH